MATRVINNRYELGAVLGQGGMGIVYRALDRFVRREVALKTVHDIIDGNTLELFYKEWGVLATLVHPNVVEIYDVGEFEDETGRKPYFVMPLLPGKTLTTLIKEAPQTISVERTIDIVCSTCRGLQAAHNKGLIHRDIKPSNIFVMSDDSVKVIDFGVAHLVDTHSTTLAKGTPSYMAPEQIRMERPSRETDIFSLGVVCYEVLAGRRPFQGTTEAVLLDEILNKHPEPLSEINSAVNQALSRVIHKSIAKQRVHRFPSAREFADALQRALYNQPLDFLDPAHYQPRIEKASRAFESGEYEVASEILGELESEGHVDPSIRMLRDRLSRALQRKELHELFEKARLYLREEEYGLALRKIQDALQFNADDTEALVLKAEIERKRDEKKTARYLQQGRRHLAIREFTQARQIVQKALALNPTDTTARDLAANIDDEERQLVQARDEKARLRAAAMEAWRKGELAAAVGGLERLIALEEKQPGTDPGTAAADRKFHQQIRAEHEEIESGLDQALAHLEADKFDEALGLCRQYLQKYPDQPRFQDLRVRIEERKRERHGERVQEYRQRALAEPNLEVRLMLIDQARREFPADPSLERLAQSERERHDLVEALSSRAQQHEERGELQQAIEQWEEVRAHHPQHADVNRHVERLNERRAELLRAQHKTEWIQQIQQQLNANDYRAAVEIGRRALERFAGDPEIESLAAQARQRRQRSEVFEQLLADARTLLSDGRLPDATAKLGLAHDLGRQGFGPPRAAIETLLESARLALQQDNWVWAADVSREAFSLAPDDPDVRRLQQQVTERQNEAHVRERKLRAQDLLDIKDYGGALTEAVLGLERAPGDARFEQIVDEAREALQKIEQRERLLDEGRRLFRGQDWERATKALGDACAVDPTDRKTQATVVTELLGHARALIETDWRAARAVLDAALQLDPSAAGVDEIRDRIARQQRATQAAEAADKVRSLERAGLVRDALAAADEALRSFPRDKALRQLQESLRKQLSQAEHREKNIDELTGLLPQSQSVSDASEAEALATHVRAIADRHPGDTQIRALAEQAVQNLAARGRVARIAQSVAHIRELEETGELRGAQAAAEAALASFPEEKTLRELDASLRKRLAEYERREKDVRALGALFERIHAVQEDREAEDLDRKAREIADRYPEDEQIRAVAAKAREGIAALLAGLQANRERERDLAELGEVLARSPNVASEAEADELAMRVREIADRHPTHEPINAKADQARRNLAAAIGRLQAENERNQSLAELSDLLARSRSVGSEAEADELAAKVRAAADHHPDDQEIQAKGKEAQRHLADAVSRFRQERECEQSLASLTPLLERSRKVANEGEANSLSRKAGEIARRHPTDTRIHAIAEQIEQNLAVAVGRIRAERQRKQDVAELKRLGKRSQTTRDGAEADDLAAAVQEIAERHAEDAEIHGLAEQARQNLAAAVVKLNKQKEREQNLAELTTLLPRSRNVGRQAEADELATRVREIAQRHPEDEQVRALAGQAEQNLATAILNLKKEEERNQNFEELTRILPRAQRVASPAEAEELEARIREIAGRHPDDKRLREMAGEAEQNLATAILNLREKERAPAMEAIPSAGEPRESAGSIPESSARSVEPPVETPGPVYAAVRERQETFAPPGRNDSVEALPSQRQAAPSTAPKPARGLWWAAAAGVAVLLGATVWMTVLREPGPEPAKVETQPAKPPGATGQAVAAEQQAFEQAQAANTLDAYQRYLKTFPNGVHRPEAVSALETLVKPASPPAVETPTRPAENKAQPEPKVTVASLSVYTVPPGAEVVVQAGGQTQRRRSGENGRLDLEVPPGEVSIEVRADGHEVYRQSRSVKAGNNEPLIASLNPLQREPAPLPKRPAAPEPSPTPPAASQLQVQLEQFRAAKERGDRAELERIAKDPSHPFAPDARTLLDDLQRQQAEAAQRQRDEAERKEFEAAAASGNRRAIQAVLAKYPNSSHIGIAQKALDGMLQRDRDAIYDVLRRYSNAFEAKNVDAIQAAWPGIPSSSVDDLRKAFSDHNTTLVMSLQQTGGLEFSPDFSTATQKCQRSTVTMRGGRSSRGPTQTVEITFVRQGDGWVIRGIR